MRKLCNGLMVLQDRFNAASLSTACLCILKLTKKGEEVIPVLKREVDYWHNSVGLAKISDESMAVIRDVARKSYNLVNE